MKVGIMQPYFFPYLGYWQLMNAVDKYVIYDDVNFINRSWINRNTILMCGRPQKINLILCSASQNKAINEIRVGDERHDQERLLRTVSQCYVKAPYYQEVMPLIETIVMQENLNLAQYLYFSFRVIGEYLGIHTRLFLSSELEKDCGLKAHKKILAICQSLGATEYYNAISGIPLYRPHKAEFDAAGIQLRFLKMREVMYSQFKNEFVPNLSIIDVMMFNSQEECQNLLNEYDLVEGDPE